MAVIAKIVGREILDSRGQPTVEAEVFLRGGTSARAAAPAGASVGAGEAAELRDQEPSRFGGRGARRAAAALTSAVNDSFSGKDGEDWRAFDAALLKMNADSGGGIGANAVVAASIANARAQARAAGLPLWKFLSHDGGGAPPVLPAPMMNLINGGAHAANNLSVQEFMIVPCGFDEFAEALRAGAEIFSKLRNILQQKNFSTGVGDEGGFAPDLPSNEEAFNLLMQAVEQAGYQPGQQVRLAADLAASSFYQDGKYAAAGAPEDAEAHIARLQEWARRWPLASLEDAMDEGDWDGWKKLTAALGKKMLLVGDDLFVTSAPRVEEGAKQNAANAVLIKPNQAGALALAEDAVKTARAKNFSFIVSHRSGETEDDAIADIAAGWGGGGIKCGAPCRGERTAKYNRLLRIAEEMGATARFAKDQMFSPIAPR